jgi:hypothetical protein
MDGVEGADFPETQLEVFRIRSDLGRHLGPSTAHVHSQHP